ncbi:MAG TPA: hypothetical protein VGL72_19155 [Bryobacteraceae bacterium]
MEDLTLGSKLFLEFFDIDLMNAFAVPDWLAATPAACPAIMCCGSMRKEA